jgi:hypothetical protein
MRWSATCHRVRYSMPGCVHPVNSTLYITGPVTLLHVGGRRRVREDRCYAATLPRTANRRARGMPHASSNPSISAALRTTPTRPPLASTAAATARCATLLCLIEAASSSHSGGRRSTAGGTGEAPVRVARWWDGRREIARAVMIALPATMIPRDTTAAIISASINIPCASRCAAFH